MRNVLNVGKKVIKQVNIVKGIKDNYYVSNDGKVYVVYMHDNEYIAKPMSPFINRDGYVEYVLTMKNGEKKHFLGHRLVAMAWLDKPKAKNVTEVNHKDGKRDNNKVNNLEWVSKSENIQHSFKKLGKKVWNSNK